MPSRRWSPRPTASRRSTPRAPEAATSRPGRHRGDHLRRARLAPHQGHRRRRRAGPLQPPRRLRDRGAGRSLRRAAGRHAPRQAPPLPPDPVAPPTAGAAGDGGGPAPSPDGGGAPRAGRAGHRAAALHEAGARPGGRLSWRCCGRHRREDVELATRAAGRPGRLDGSRARDEGTSALLRCPVGGRGRSARRSRTSRSAVSERRHRAGPARRGRAGGPAVGVLDARDRRRRLARRRPRGPGGRDVDHQVGRGPVVVLVRGVRKSADVEVTAGGGGTYRVSGSATTATRRSSPARGRARAA